MLKRVSLSIFVFALLLISSCSSNRILEYGTAEEALQMANEYFNEGKYRKAIPYYQKIVNESSTILMADAQMKLADSFFNRHDYIDARFEYEEFIRQFSDHREVAKAFFQIGVCYYELSAAPHYDQTETYSAIDAFKEYLERFPFDQRKEEAIEYIKNCQMKLFEKKYWNGYAYYKISDFPAALLYFNEITDLNNINEIDRNARFYSAMIYIARKDLVNAEATTQILVERYPDSKQSAKIKKKLEKLRNRLTKE